MTLRGQIKELGELSAADRRAMFELMDRHYANLTPTSFAQDLAEKQWILQIIDSGQKLCGFSTQMVLEATVDGRPIKALFSGDTIVDQEHWGSRALLQAWGELALSLMTRWPDGDLYWYLICQGYKTYRFLPLFFEQYYPRCDGSTPPDMKSVLDTLGLLKFPQSYDPAKGIVVAHDTQYRLREGVADVTPDRCRDPHIRYFAERNPGHARGDELCCIAPLNVNNFTAAGRRVLGLSL